MINVLFLGRAWSSGSIRSGWPHCMSKFKMPTKKLGNGSNPNSMIIFLKRVLGEEKYGPGSEPQWKAGGTRYPDLYKALLEEPSRTRRTKLLEDKSRGKMGDGRIVRRPARARIRNQ